MKPLPKWVYLRRTAEEFFPELKGERCKHHFYNFFFTITLRLLLPSKTAQRLQTQTSRRHAGESGWPSDQVRHILSHSRRGTQNRISLVGGQIGRTVLFDGTMSYSDVLNSPPATKHCQPPLQPVSSPSEVPDDWPVLSCQSELQPAQSSQSQLSEHVFEKVSEASIVVDGFKFLVRRRNKNNIKYRCSTKNPHCPASCTTDNDMSQLLSVSGIHNHDKHVHHM